MFLRQRLDVIQRALSEVLDEEAWSPATPRRLYIGGADASSRGWTMIVPALADFFLDHGGRPEPRLARLARALRCPGYEVDVRDPDAIALYEVDERGRMRISGARRPTAPGGDDLIPNPLVTDTAASGQVLGALQESSLFYQGAADWDGQVQDCTSGTCAFYAYVEGTSAAAPQVTGVAALVISRFGKQWPDELADRLIDGATPLACPPSPYDPGGTGQPATCCGPPANTNFYGAGEVDALAALQE